MKRNNRELKMSAGSVGGGFYEVFLHLCLGQWS